MSEADLEDKDDLVLALREELEKALDKEHDDATYRAMPNTIMSVLAGSVRIQRLYFVIRSVIMGLISALIYFLVVWFLSKIDAVQAAILGIFVFIISLIVSRLFDGQIVKASQDIVGFLRKHKRLRTFVLKRL